MFRRISQCVAVSEKTWAYLKGCRKSTYFWDFFNWSTFCFKRIIFILNGDVHDPSWRAVSSLHCTKGTSAAATHFERPHVSSEFPSATMFVSNLDSLQTRPFAFYLSCSRFFIVIVACASDQLYCSSCKCGTAENNLFVHKGHTELFLNSYWGRRV